jgi:hypothetical protein
MTAFPLPAGPTLPGFRASLDPHLMRALIADRLARDVAIAACEPIYVRYKGNDGSLVGWSVATSCSESDGRTFVTARSAPLWRLRNEAARLSARSGEVFWGLGALALVEEHELLLLAFPVDRALAELRRMVRPFKIRQLVEGGLAAGTLAGLRLSKRKSRVGVVRYKPERRAVLRWELAMVDASGAVRARPGAYVRVYDKQQGGQATAVQRAVAAAGIRCAAILAAPHEGLTVEAELAGASAERWSPPQCEAAASLLARLHRATPPAGLPHRRAVDAMDDVLRACRDLACLDEELGARAAAIADRLSSRLPRGGEPRLTHGDFHSGQVLFEGGESGVIDFDRAVVGCPARDLATFHAHRLAAAGGEPDGVSELLVERYRRLAELGRELEWEKACAVLLQSMAPFRTLDPDWPARTRLLLVQAEALSRGAACA